MSSESHSHRGAVERLIDFGFFTVNFLKSRHKTGDALDLLELALCPEGRMPVPRWHRDWDETVYGVEGVVTYAFKGERHDSPPGYTTDVPRPDIHDGGGVLIQVNVLSSWSRVMDAFR